MKFLISNYSTPWNTESFYIHESLSRIGEEVSLYNNQNSVYDEFDKFQPDVFITHISFISKDVMHYITKNKKSTLLININNIDTENLQRFSDSLNANQINAIFFGEHDLDIKNTQFIKIMPSADIYLNSSGNQYNIDKLIFVEREEDIVSLDGTYHYTSCNQNLINKVDFVVPINLLASLFPNYREIIFKGESYIGSQVSFNAIYAGTKVIFDTKNASSLEKIDNIFKGNKLLSSVKNKHTCLHRTKSLLSKINNKNIIEKLEREIEKI